MMVGMSESGVLVDHLVCLLARRSRPYAAVLKVGRVVVKEYGKVLLSWEGITLVVLGMVRRRFWAVPGILSFPRLRVHRGSPGLWGDRRIACGRAGW